MYGIQFPTDPMMDHFLSSVCVCVCAHVLRLGLCGGGKAITSACVFKLRHAHVYYVIKGHALDFVRCFWSCKESGWTGWTRISFDFIWFQVAFITSWHVRAISHFPVVVSPVWLHRYLVLTYIVVHGALWASAHRCGHHNGGATTRRPQRENEKVPV